MKNLYQLALFVLLSNTLTAQILLEDNFENYTLGNISTKVENLSVQNPVIGQGDWVTIATSDVVDNNYFNIVENSGNKYAEIKPHINSNNILNKDLKTLWAARTEGHNIASYSMDVFSGEVNTSGTSTRIFILNENNTKTLGAFRLNHATLELIVIVNSASTDSNAGNYNFQLKEGGLILQPNTWYKLLMEINLDSGRLTIKVPQLNINQSLDKYTTPGTFGTLISGESLGGLSIQNYPQQATLVSVDNIKLEALNSSLITKNVHLDKIKIAENPVKDQLTIISDKPSIKTEIFDATGRLLLKSNDKNINVKHLQNGIYYLKVMGVKQTKSIKFIKQ